MSLNTNTLPTASDLSSEKRSVCLINDSFPPVIDGVANAVTNYATTKFSNVNSPDSIRDVGFATMPLQ